MKYTMEEKKEGRGRIRFFSSVGMNIMGCVRTTSLSGYYFITFFFRRVHHLRICRFDAIILGGGKQCDGSWAEEGRRGEVIIKLNEKIYIHTKNKYVSDQTMGRHNFDCQNQYY